MLRSHYSSSAAWSISLARSTTLNVAFTSLHESVLQQQISLVVTAPVDSGTACVYQALDVHREQIDRCDASAHSESVEVVTRDGIG